MAEAGVTWVRIRINVEVAIDVRNNHNMLQSQQQNVRRMIKWLNFVMCEDQQQSESYTL